MVHVIYQQNNTAYNIFGLKVSVYLFTEENYTYARESK